MIAIDPEKRIVTITVDGKETAHPLDSREAFEALSAIWVRSGWEAKYLYTFTWFGRPIIQLPDDMFRVQEVLYSLRPEVVIETGVAHGGSLVFYASIFEAMKHGRVIGVDVEIRPHNRAALESHELFHRIELVEGDSTSPAILREVHSHIKPGESAIVFLDSNHSYEHVRRELELYAPFVTPGSYIVSTDGIMKDLVGSPRSESDWGTNNPYHAAQDFLKDHPEFELHQPEWQFNESADLRNNVTQWPGAWLRRR